LWRGREMTSATVPRWRRVVSDGVMLRSARYCVCSPWRWYSSWHRGARCHARSRDVRGSESADRASRTRHGG
jgi:hypothetical protein